MIVSKLRSIGSTLNLDELEADGRRLQRDSEWP